MHLEQICKEPLVIGTKTSLPAIFRNFNKKNHIERPDLIQRSLNFDQVSQNCPRWWGVKILQAACFL